MYRPHVSADGGRFGRNGNNPGRPRRFRGQYVRSRVSPSRSNSNGNQYQDDQQLSSLPSQSSNNYNQHHHQQQHNNNYQQSSSRAQPHRQRHNSASQYQDDFVEIKDLCSHLSAELDIVKKRIEDIAVSLEVIQQQQKSQLQLQQQQHSQHQPLQQQNSAGSINNLGTEKIKRKTKLLKRKVDQQQIDNKQPGTTTTTTTTNNEQPVRDPSVVGKPKRLNKREYQKELKQRNLKPLPQKQPNDDSTTQAADPSSEDKPEGDDSRPVGERVRVFRRKKQHFNKRGYQGNRRRRFDSSERNSNDTSPQNEVNGDDYRSNNKHSRSSGSKIQRKTSFPELSESELNEVAQTLKRDFLAAELGSVRKMIDEKGPVAAQEFATSILDHAICDVTSPTKLSDIANNLFHILESDSTSVVEFQQSFCSALNDISKREEDIAIDAPRYMDTLGHVIGQCLVPMNTSRNKSLLKKFLNECLQSYTQQSRALLLASIMRGVAGHKSDRFAKDVWNTAGLKWDDFLNEGTNINEFLESQDVAFTTKEFSPEPQKSKRTPEELAKFADDVTDFVEKRCTIQELNDLVKNLDLDLEELIDYLGTLVYAIVRGCLATDSENYQLNPEALTKYSSLLNGKHFSDIDDGLVKSVFKKDQDAIALHALTALTKLWHHHNCPQNLMSTILLALHSHGAASYDALKTWLNSDDLKNIPGIGAARLNSKRCIEDLGAARG